MLRTPPKDGETSKLSSVQSEPNIPVALTETPSKYNVNVRPKRPRTDCSPDTVIHHSITKEYLDIIRQEIRTVLTLEVSANIKTSMNEELREIKEMFRELKDSVHFMSDEFDSMKTELDKCKSDIKNLHKENEVLKTTVADLSMRMNLIEQHSRQQNIEINGIPENKAENLVKTIVQMGNIVSNTIKEEDILSAVRVRKLDPENKNPRAVIVKLRSVLLRDTILTSVMKFNRLHPKEKLSTQHLGYGDPVRPIFVSEHLSPLNKKIHAAARKAAREKGYLYVWVRDGKVLVRKSDGQQARHMKSLEAVETL
ncbi:unnamed protein product [Euphydryas editha]|uniref:FP protein C-terminal domain-containing protein n=1 Tax=Euphydryas editha TaxID=104508 RepID=A0AAU9TJ02_EUPED|nr:unnamed protein product [Euphydryas editha]